MTKRCIYVGKMSLTRVFKYPVFFKDCGNLDSLTINYGCTGWAFPTGEGTWDFRMDGKNIAFLVRKKDLFFTP